MQNNYKMLEATNKNEAITSILDAVKHGVSMEHKIQVNPYFEHGSIWCDHIK